MALRRREERGAYAILFAILVAVLFIMVAIGIDLSDARAEVRANQSRTDFASLAAASQIETPPAACAAAWAFLLENTPGLAGAPTPCFNPPMPSNCDLSMAWQGTTQWGPYLVVFTWPVLDDDPLMEDRTGSPDGNPCERFGVSIRTLRDALFGGIVGSSGLGAPATSVARGFQGGRIGMVPALLILDPVACNVLTTSGQGNIRVQGALGVDPETGEQVSGPGFIAVDSSADGGSGSNNCNTGNRVAIDANDNNNNFIIAEGDPLAGGLGLISAFGMATGQTRCDTGNIRVCDQKDVEAVLGTGERRLDPMPTRLLQRITRAPVDHRYNCNENYGPLGIEPCEEATPGSVRGPADGAGDYIDRLVADVGTLLLPQGSFTWWPGSPLSWRNYLTDDGVRDYATNDPLPPGPGRCSMSSPARVIVEPGNWGVDCTSANPAGFRPSNRVEFLGGNIVFQDKVDTQSFGAVAFNVPNPDLPLDDVNKCPESQPSAFIYVRSGNFDISSQGSLVVCNATVYVHDGTVKALTAGDTLTWIAPFDGPFEDLALWSESSGQHQLGGQTKLSVEGVFFTPAATPFTFSGQPAQKQTKAQFITFRLNVGGQGGLLMQPDPFRAVVVPFRGVVLIR